jgi:hypothetical protein
MKRARKSKASGTSVEGGSREKIIICYTEMSRAPLKYILNLGNPLMPSYVS